MMYMPATESFPPIAIRLMLACHIGTDPASLFGKDEWNSSAMLVWRKKLYEDGLVTENLSTTPRGEAWVNFICSTPLPVQQWVRP